MFCAYPLNDNFVCSAFHSVLVSVGYSGQLSVFVCSKHFKNVYFNSTKMSVSSHCTNARAQSQNEGCSPGAGD